jgi:hypothetical protein
MFTFRKQAFWLLYIFHLFSVILISPLARPGASTTELAARLTIFAIALTQSALLGLWIGMGNAALIWRLSGGLLAILGLSALANALVGFHEAVWYLAPMSAAIAIAMWLARVAGYQWVDLTIASSLTNNGRGQFQIRHVIVLTVFSAFVIWIGKNISVPVYHVQTVIFWDAAFAVVALGAIWASLGPGSPASRIPIVLVAASVIGWATSFSFYPEPVNLQFWVPFHMALFALILSVSLLVFRWCGFRILHRDGDLSVETQ